MSVYCARSGQWALKAFRVMQRGVRKCSPEAAALAAMSSLGKVPDTDRS